MQVNQHCLKLLRANEASAKQIIVGFFKNTGHDNFSDAAFLLQNELSLRGQIGPKYYVDTAFYLINKLIVLFLDEFSTHLPFKNADKSQHVLEQLNQFSSSVMSVNNPFHRIILEKTQEKKDQ